MCLHAPHPSPARPQLLVSQGCGSGRNPVFRNCYESFSLPRSSFFWLCPWGLLKPRIVIIPQRFDSLWSCFGGLLMPQFHRCCLPTPVILALTRDAASCSSAASPGPYMKLGCQCPFVCLFVRSFVRRLLLAGRFQALPTVVVRLSVCLSLRNLLVDCCSLGGFRPCPRWWSLECG